jgi:surface protein
MSYMFIGASAFNQDISNWNTINVINMEGMFQNAISITDPGIIAKWDTSKVKNMKNIFFISLIL